MHRDLMIAAVGVALVAATLGCQQAKKRGSR
jgi:hypothetical protein